MSDNLTYLIHLHQLGLHSKTSKSFKRYFDVIIVASTVPAPYCLCLAAKSRLHNRLIKTDKTDLRHDYAVSSYGSPSLHQTIKEVGEQVGWGLGCS